MPSFDFPEIDFTHSFDFRSKTYLWIWHANKIPPHIGISTYNSYFSLKVSGKDTALPCERTLQKAQKKNIALLLIELDVNFSLDQIAKVYQNYTAATPFVATCLTPIVQLLGLHEVNQLSEMLHKLAESNTLGKVFGLNLPDGYSSLPDYSPSDIQFRLKHLVNAERKTSLSTSS